MEEWQKNVNVTTDTLHRFYKTRRVCVEIDGESVTYLDTKRAIGVGPTAYKSRLIN